MAAKKPYPKGKKAKAKIALAMRHFKEGKMHAGKKTGPVVRKRKRAVAIALSMARKVAKGGGKKRR